VIAAAVSEHPLATHAVGEAAGAVLERTGPQVDLAVVVVTGAHAGALEEVAATVRRALRPAGLVGAAAASVLADHREVEEQPAVAVWAARIGRVETVRITAERRGPGVAVGGIPRRCTRGEHTLVLLGDPVTFPTEPLLDELATTCPGLTVVGGLVAGATGPGPGRLLVDDRLVTDGAVGVLLDRDADVATVVAQGSRPIGDPMAVTRGEGTTIRELAGRPALERLREVLAGVAPEHRALARQGLRIGRVIEDRAGEPGPGAVVVRDIAGVDPETGAIAVAAGVDVGQVVRFHVRDARAADEDLRERLAPLRADGALVFTGAARGRAFFGYPDHDADVIATALGTRAVAGVFCAGEVGPIGRRSYLHGSSAVALLVRPRLATPGGPGRRPAAG